MQWGLAWGPNAEFLAAIAEDTGVVPQALQDKPVISKREGYYLQVFNELSYSRTFGEVPGPIPISQLLSYCVFWGIYSPPEREILFKYMSALDRVYLKYQVEERQRRQKQTNRAK